MRLQLYKFLELSRRIYRSSCPFLIREVESCHLQHKRLGASTFQESPSRITVLWFLLAMTVSDYLSTIVHTIEIELGLHAAPAESCSPGIVGSCMYMLLRRSVESSYPFGSSRWSGSLAILAYLYNLVVLENRMIIF